MNAYPPDFAKWSLADRNKLFKAEADAYAARQQAAAPEPFYEPPGEPVANWKAALTPASTIKPEPISWLWNGWLARGKMHIIAGQPGTGKTTTAMKMAATVSHGGRWPDGSRARQGNVVIWSGEDDPADTLVPRLEASGADLTRIFFAGDMTRGGERRPFDPAQDIPALQSAIEAAGGAAMIVVDPIVSATAADSHKNGETRRALQPLVDMSAKLAAALIGITHFTKGSEGRSPIDRVTGSVAFGALARVVMVAAMQQPGEDGSPSPRILMRAKSNIGPDDGGFNYELQAVPMREHPDIVASVVSWGEAVTGAARDILAEAEARPEDDAGEGSAFREAKDWLLDFLIDGPRSAKEVKAGANEAGHSWATIRRAKDALGVASTKSLGDGAWAWSLPQVDQPKARCSNPSNRENLEHLERLQEKQWVSDYQDAQGAQDAQGFEVEQVVEHLAEAERDFGLDETAIGGWEGEI